MLLNNAGSGIEATVNKAAPANDAAFAFKTGFSARALIGLAPATGRAEWIDGADLIGMTPRQIDWRILIPQMWTYALPGLSNLWMILIKATPLLFILGIEDIVYWARELGGTKTSAFAYPHPDWRLYYFLGLLIFYLFMTWISERIIQRLTGRLSRGQATLAGDYATALEYQDRLMPLHTAIFLEPGLAGAKYGLSLLGRCTEEVRLPLVGLTDGTKDRIRAAMVHAGLLN